MLYGEVMNFQILCHFVNVSGNNKMDVVIGTIQNNKSLIFFKSFQPFIQRRKDNLYINDTF